MPSEHFETNIAARDYWMEISKSSFSYQIPDGDLFNAEGQFVLETYWGSTVPTHYVRSGVEIKYNGRTEATSCKGFVYSPVFGIQFEETIASTDKIYVHYEGLVLNEDCYTWDLTLTAINIYVNSTLMETYTPAGIGGTYYKKRLNDSRVTGRAILELVNTDIEYAPVAVGCGNGQQPPPPHSVERTVKVNAVAIGGWRWDNAGILTQENVAFLSGSVPTPIVIPGCGTLTCTESLPGITGNKTNTITAEGDVYHYLLDIYPIPTRCLCPNQSIIDVTYNKLRSTGWIKQAQAGTQPTNTTGLLDTVIYGKSSRTCYWPLVGGDQATSETPSVEVSHKAYSLKTLLYWDANGDCPYYFITCPELGGGGGEGPTVESPKPITCNPALIDPEFCVYFASIEVDHPALDCEAYGSPCLDYTWGRHYRAFTINQDVWLGTSDNLYPRNWQDEPTTIQADWVRIQGNKYRRDPWVYIMYRNSGSLYYTRVRLGDLDPPVGDIHVLQAVNGYGDFVLMQPGEERVFYWVVNSSGYLYCKVIASGTDDVLIATTYTTRTGIDDNTKLFVADKQLAVENYVVDAGVRGALVAGIVLNGTDHKLNVWKTTADFTQLEYLINIKTVASGTSISYFDMIYERDDRRIFVYYVTGGIAYVQVIDIFGNVLLAETALTGTSSLEFCVRESRGTKGAQWIEHLDTNLISKMTQKVSNFI